METVVVVLVALVVLIVMIGIGSVEGRVKRTERRVVRIERQVDRIVQQLGLDEVDPDLRRVVALLRDGKKIQAIKAYREITGVGLKEAKDAVERLG